MKNKSWKTTLFGVLGAIVIAVKPIILTGAIDPTSIVLAVCVAAFGYLSKDHDVTGGTIEQ